jgi:hypothetical protein
LSFLTKAIDEGRAQLDLELIYSLNLTPWFLLKGSTDKFNYLITVFGLITYNLFMSANHLSFIKQSQSAASKALAV